MIGSRGKHTVHTKTYAKNWIKFFHKSVQHITLLLLRCLAKFFDVSRITIYAWLAAWENRGICGLINRKGQGRKPILSLQNQQHVEKIKALIAGNPQSVKSVVAEIEPALGLRLHPETLKRFLKNLVSVSAASAPVSGRGKWQLSEKRGTRR